MANSFQSEIPKARVNISLDLHTGDAKKKMELPLNLLVVGNYSGCRNETSVSDREKININKENFNSVLKTINPKIKINADNKINNDNTEIPINLSFTNINSFSPDNIIQQVPELKKLLAIRNLLKELKANISDNSKLRQELESILVRKDKTELLYQELKQLSSSISSNN